MSVEKGLFTQQEIFSQPDAWVEALDVLKTGRQTIRKIDIGSFDQLIFTGCGSTYYLSLAAASLTQTLTGRLCRAFPASELWLYPQSSYSTGRTLLVAVSRSGETSETLHACQVFLDQKRGELLTLSCYENMPLAKMGNLNLVLPSGQERSVAQTRAFSTLYLSTVFLACLWAGRMDLADSLDLLPGIGTNLLKENAQLTAKLGQDMALERFYWLGSGLRYGLACELSLKMKEMSLTHSEPFHFMEFRHGPKSMVNEQTLVIGLRSTLQIAYEAAVLEDMSALGGRLLDIGDDGYGKVPSGMNKKVRLGSKLDEAVRNILFLPVGQLIAFERSLAKGLNPDLPNNLDAVVKLV
jgi:glucosamine--fructose-6-phosphate aminotransferase (isomerizing)